MGDLLKRLGSDEGSPESLTAWSQRYTELYEKTMRWVESGEEETKKGY
jgi:hypothetical protein